MRVVLGLSAFLASSSVVLAFPAYASLAGLSQRDLDAIIPTLHLTNPESPPGPLNDTSAKLVNDKAHPFRAPRISDMRGPCPGLNTLANHGYLPRNGIATPAQIINAVQDGFNMDNTIARFVTYAAFLVDGNVITNQLSIGGKSPLTGPNPPAPAIVGGLDTHAVFEGDASMTRADAFFGNNHDFNATLFNEFIDFSNRFGGGNYNLTVAAQLRFQRIRDSIATNPTFSFVAPRFFTAYAESVFPINFFVDGRKNDGQLDMNAARGFFQFGRMPEGFFRANGSKSVEGIDVVAGTHPFAPGANAGKVNSFTLDPTSADFSTFCLLYDNFVNKTIKGLYPNPKRALRAALNRNLDFLFQPVGQFVSGCPQVFPFGTD